MTSWPCMLTMLRDRRLIIGELRRGRRTGEQSKKLCLLFPQSVSPECQSLGDEVECKTAVRGFSKFLSKKRRGPSRGRRSWPGWWPPLWRREIETMISHTQASLNPPIVVVSASCSGHCVSHPSRVYVSTLAPTHH